MRQELTHLLEKVTAKYRNDPSLALPQLEYLAAKALLDTLREQASKEYMWTGEHVSDEVFEKIAEHDVEVDRRLGVYEAEDYIKEKRKALIAWSAKMSIEKARKHGMPKKVIQDIQEMHENIHRHPVQQDKLIDIALRLHV